MSTSEPYPRQTTFITVLTTEEVPVLSPAERAAMMTSLAEAEEDAKAGRGAVFEPEAFVHEMMARRARFATKKAV